MPKELPYFPFYAKDFAADGAVEAMTTQEVGAYILLLCKAWAEDPVGSVPDNDRILSRWTRLTTEEWTACREGVLAAFKLGDDSRWHQKRLAAEYEKLASASVAKSERGKKNAGLRWHGKPNAVALLDACNGNATALQSPCGVSGDAPKSGANPSEVAPASPSRPISPVSSGEMGAQNSMHMAKSDAIALRQHCNGIATRCYSDSDSDSDYKEEGGAIAPAPLADEISAAWNQTPGVARVRKLDHKRRTAIGARLKSPDFRDNWREALGRVAASSFCTGANDRGWKADLDWFIRDGTVTRILEGKYDDGQPRAGPNRQAEVTPETSGGVAFLKEFYLDSGRDVRGLCLEDGTGNREVDAS